jgi:hypothetical protein
MSKETPKSRAVRKAKYITRGEYKTWFESASAASIRKGKELQTLRESNVDLGKMLANETSKVVKARIAHTKLMADYDAMILTSQNRRDKIVVFQSVQDMREKKLKKFTDLSGFRKIVVILSDSVVNFIG